MNCFVLGAFGWKTQEYAHLKNKNHRQVFEYKNFTFLDNCSWTVDKVKTNLYQISIFWNGVRALNCLTLHTIMNTIDRLSLVKYWDTLMLKQSSQHRYYFFTCSVCDDILCFTPLVWWNFECQIGLVDASFLIMFTKKPSICMMYRQLKFHSQYANLGRNFYVECIKESFFPSFGFFCVLIILALQQPCNYA